MPDLVWIVDPATGDLVIEGLQVADALELAGDLLPPPRELNCAQPLATAPLPVSGSVVCDPVLRVASLYHSSVVEGPGRRSVLQVQGCPLLCSLACFVPETHSLDDGVVLPVNVLIEALLDPLGHRVTVSAFWAESRSPSLSGWQLYCAASRHAAFTPSSTPATPSKFSPGEPSQPSAQRSSSLTCSSTAHSWQPSPTAQASGAARATSGSSRTPR